MSLRADHYDKACALRDTLSDIIDSRATLTDVIGRALECLADAHERGAWLSPKEAAPLLEQRMLDQTVSLIAQFIAHKRPDLTIEGIAVDKIKRLVLIQFEGDEPGVPLVMAPASAPDN